MTSTAKVPRYSPATLERAERAVRCAPFQLKLFTTMRRQSVDIRAIAGSAGVENGYSQQPLPEMAVEQLMLWLIQVGLLRREVDGQGLTSSFRLTPLGHLLVEQWQQGGKLPAANWRDRLYNSLSRWLRLPDWLQPL
ncbi:hypothetical protein HJG54_13780 [Leptolyngbya sp. NK1-12]|uniref:Uncharacterized protein n=1 Tax=Leptolyngbya sp. NK1-12 TaxID=2547451 RepID=A0AA97AG19_9CYAN|nr:hypothetical protein HJG54_13780 [Leptolyngbya sp. NK1-12]